MGRASVVVKMAARAIHGSRRGAVTPTQPDPTRPDPTREISKLPDQTRPDPRDFKTPADPTRYDPREKPWNLGNRGGMIIIEPGMAVVVHRKTFVNLNSRAGERRCFADEVDAMVNVCEHFFLPSEALGAALPRYLNPMADFE